MLRDGLLGLDEVQQGLDLSLSVSLGLGLTPTLDSAQVSGIGISFSLMQKGVIVPVHGLTDPVQALSLAVAEP